MMLGSPRSDEQALSWEGGPRGLEALGGLPPNFEIWPEGDARDVADIMLLIMAYYGPG